MCGRFTRFTSASTIAETFSAMTTEMFLEPSFNVVPTQEIYVVTGGSVRQIQALRWGLVPSWSPDINRASSMVNARIESVNEKPSFRNLILNNRCIIPMNGYYEWAVINVNGSANIRQPYYFQAKSHSKFCHDKMLAVAAVWTTWESTNDSYSSCAALTTEAVHPISTVHHRMPVLLDAEGIQSWLSAETVVDINQFRKPTKSYIEMYPVSTRVNNARLHGQDLIERIEIDVQQQESLF